MVGLEVKSAWLRPSRGNVNFFCTVLPFISPPNTPFLILTQTFVDSLSYFVHMSNCLKHTLKIIQRPTFCCNFSFFLPGEAPGPPNTLPHSSIPSGLADVSPPGWAFGSAPVFNVREKVENEFLLTLWDKNHKLHIDYLLIKMKKKTYMYLSFKWMSVR
jgi:hypothetical protein